MRVFVAEDDSELRALVVSALTRDGHDVSAVGDGIALMLDLTARPVPDEVVVIADVRMPMIGALPVFRALARTGRCPPFVLMTAFPCVDVRREAAQLGAVALLEKPFDLDLLRGVVRHLAQALRPPPRPKLSTART